ncbi:hypothetical protein [Salininema proteolyticum]|uniref:Uncharacterized protein n=1 Tax=Salininema proteolyticum TaxID=1607685 RepID=A0ABV8U267_9ACTN
MGIGYRAASAVLIAAVAAGAASPAAAAPAPERAAAYGYLAEVHHSSHADLEACRKAGGELVRDRTDVFDFSCAQTDATWGLWLKIG